ncbi:MAG: glycerol-phosphatase [Pseudonocardiales bacterium]|jgi:HAD superfamily hydrolase (TIGR01450 family)|nr:glycerol-phosphatase [Pseudonocardiales bacterium]
MRRVTTVAMPLQATAEPLAEIYDVALLDLDGVVYVGQHAVPGIPEALAAVRAVGMRLAFVTNNAARPPAVVARHLSALGIAAEPGEVINSAQAAAHYLADRLSTGATVLVVGTTGLEEALVERGLVPVHSADDDPQAVVQGYSPDLEWRQLAEGAVAIRRGLLWVATNVDPTVPSPRGPLPGNGSLVAALRHATGAEPVVTGKPNPAMHLESVQRSGAQRPIVVGDRLDTDVEGANAAGCPSLLVFTGVTSAADLLAAAPAMRPTYVAPGAGGLLTAHKAPTLSDGVARCGDWEVRRAGGELTLAHTTDGGLPSSDDDLDPLRALCALAWSLADSAEADDAGDSRISGSDEVAAAALRALGLSA